MGVMTPQLCSHFVEYRPVHFRIRHDVDKFLSVIDSFLGVRVNDRNIECWCSYEDEVYVQRLLQEKNILSKKIVALGIGGSVKRKHWPISKYEKFILQLLELDKNIHFIIVGGNEDADDGEILTNGVLKHQIINMAGKLTWTQSIAMMKHCFMYIGSDTSTLHFAAALKMPVLTVNCYPAELGLHDSSIPVKDAPYNVPSVTVLPKYALDECKNNQGHVSGCSRDSEVHCIKQINESTLLRGYKLLIQQIKTNNVEPQFIC